jgi:hypothetical protein
VFDSVIGLLLSWGSARLQEEARGVVKAGEGCGVLGLEPTVLGRSEVLGDREGGEVVERTADLLEAALVLQAAWGDRAHGRLVAQPAERVAQQRAAVRFVRAAKERDELRGFGRGQAVSLGAVEKPVLVLDCELAQGARECRADSALGELLLCGGRQAGAKGQARLDPSRLVAQQPRDAAWGQPVVLGERADHPRLVERRQGARRGVGHEQEALVLGRQRRPLDDDGHLCRALLAPAGQALEAVHNLEEALVGGDNAQRELGQLLRCAVAPSGSQLRETAPESVNGQPPHGV